MSQSMSDTPPVAPPPILDNQLALLRQAVAVYRPVRRAARVALTSAVSALIIAILSFPAALVMLDFVSVLLLLALFAAGVVEFFGRKRLLRIDLAAPRLLALNQLAILGAIAVYCIVKMLTIDLSMLEQVSLPPESEKQLADIFGGSATPGGQQATLKTLLNVMVIGFYSLIIILSAFFQGGMAIYYITRRGALRKFDDLRPDWPKAIVIEMHK